MKHTFILIFLVFTFSAQCQNIFVTYSRVNNIEEQLDVMERKYKHMKSDIRSEMADMMNMDMTFLLQHSSGYSKFKMLDNENEVSQKEINVAGNTIIVMQQKSKMDPHIYKNIIDKKSWSLIDVFGKGFIVFDSLIFNWEFHADRKMIGEYECHRATVFHDGLEVEAWYAEDIPVFDGPDIYGGLPGLILELKSNKFNFTALEVSITNEEIVLTKPNGYPEMNREDFENHYQKRMQSLYPSGAKITKYK